jgi:hypothetical protein
MSYTMSIGHWTVDTHGHSMVVDTHTWQFVSVLQLHALLTPWTWMLFTTPRARPALLLKVG